ncbi:hypothetical protein J2739_003420 [Variovorax soli]|uniref:Lipoprotein n=1 Tax=Variovorax soli TaxID=376815 RepID=A0ABU1NGR0_9BURK|nr:hypothetical protein [Variovorax soli]
MRRLTLTFLHSILLACSHSASRPAGEPYVSGQRSGSHAI